MKYTDPSCMVLFDRSIDANKSLKTPLRSCCFYGTYFDGNEGSLYCVASASSINDCKNFVRKHNVGAIDLDENHSHFVSVAQTQLLFMFNIISLLCTTCSINGNRKVQLIATLESIRCYNEYKLLISKKYFRYQREAWLVVASILLQPMG